MTYLPGIQQPIPANYLYPNSAGDELAASEFPMIYTTDGPIKVTNGLAFTADAFAFVPDSVNAGTFDCGTFGTQS